MKQLFSCFLFRKRPEDGLSAPRRAAFWLWNGLLMLGAALALGLLCLMLAPAQYGWELFYDYLDHPALVALNLLPPVVLMALLYGLSGRAWLAYALTSLPVLGLAAANAYKMFFRDDPVIAADLLLLGEAGNMAGKYQLFLFGKLAAALGCALVSALLLALLARGRPLGRFRAGIAGTALACAAALSPLYASDQVYQDNANEEHINKWSVTQQYVSRGLLYPFLHSVKDAFPRPPEGYDQREAEGWLAQFEDGAIPEGKKVNIVGIMLEAFTDFSQFEEIQFSQDVYAIWHALEAEGYSGALLSNIFAGGTVNTERAFLTGVADGNYDYRGEAPSYVRYLKGQGYRATGSHPSYNWFYNRQNVNAYLGFDSYRFTEDYFGPVYGADPVLNDDGFLPDLTRTVLEQLEQDAPLFSFSVTYQGHGPYGDRECWWGEPEDFFTNPGLDDASRYILSNYLGSVMATQRYLSDMVDAFRASDEPIVLVVFGDHKPWLGNGNSVYHALGVNLDQDSREGFYNYWSTPYLIWANEAAKAAVGRDIAGEGPDISPCFLMNVLFEQLGWTGDAYMQAADQCRAQLPVIHSHGVRLTAGGELTAQLPPEQAELARRLLCLSYCRAHQTLR
ncbi:MAG: LTA synthase family protein [Oscillospiraceae bacterium]|jgi:phosphoglycerol transferase MdoB-like AlkP superfamily enzyme|nr:LTA synthase family protein [Oscillospiraceae bacterium]MCI9550745.1 LTA synthase family protein [Oscillospiraceae bacterium]